MNNDYYFDYVNATSRLSAAKYVIENMLRAIETNDKVDLEVAKRLATSEIVEIANVLSGEER